MKTNNSGQETNALSRSSGASETGSPPPWVCTLYFVLSIFFLNFFCQALFSARFFNSLGKISPQPENVSPSSPSHGF